tara:strand:+ start:58 stop:267 length:210 start_codon:yes stop_codon:yes gene_type:complete
MNGDHTKYDREALALADNPETHYWVADTIRIALKKDPVDALCGLEVVAEVFKRRWDSMASDWKAHKGDE